MMRSLLLLVVISVAHGFHGVSRAVTGDRVVVTKRLGPHLGIKQSSGFSVARSPVRVSMSTTEGSSVPAAAVATGSAGSVEATSSGIFQKLKVGGLFGLWYALNVGYNIYNKKVLNMVPELTYTIAFLQLFLGLAYVIPVWGSGARKAPELSTDDVKTLMPVAVLHCLTHLGAIVSLGAGAVSFTHIVKAAEPAVSAGLSAIFLKQFLPLPVALTLVPVMGGVAIASLKELSFSWLAFGGAMISNFASAGRGIVGKMQMGKSVGKNMNAANLYAVMTIISSVLCLPLALALEGTNIMPTLAKIKEAGLINTLYLQTAASAILYYLYNEVAFLTLDNVAPVTHALGNTIKRVVIILASVVWLGSTMTAQGAFGSVMAIGGVLLYSLAKGKFK